MQGTPLSAFVQNPGRVKVSSSVLAGPITRGPEAVLICTDTYGADYELLNATCQPQVP